LAFDLFGQRVDRTALRISNHVSVLLKRGLRIAMPQLPLYNSERSAFFK
jgi:hypothetical protein